MHSLKPVLRKFRDTNYSVYRLIEGNVAVGCRASVFKEALPLAVLKMQLLICPEFKSNGSRFVSVIDSLPSGGTNSK